MITSLQLLTMLSDYLVVSDLADLTIGQRVLIAQRINAALIDYAAAVPKRHRVTEINALLEPPTNISLTTTAGSTAITTTPVLSASNAGASLIVSNEAFWHRLDATGLALRMPAASTGTTTAMLYHDTILLPPSYDGMASALSAQWPSGVAYAIIPASSANNTMGWPGHTNSTTVWNPSFVGPPAYYEIYTEDTANADGTPGARSTLRLFPLPQVLQRIHFQHFARPVRWTTADFTTARTLDLTDDAWSLILDLIVAQLAGTTLLREGTDLNLVLRNAEAARQSLRTLNPYSPGPLRLRTRAGF